MPLAKKGASHAPEVYVFNGMHTLGTIFVSSVGAGAANTTLQQPIFPLVTAAKIYGLAVSFTAINAVTGHSFNLVYNTASTPGVTGAEGAVAANDDSYTYTTTTTLPGATQGNLGYPTNGAVDGNILLASDVTFNTTNFPGMTTGGGGIGLFYPANYDAVYPSGPLSLTSAGVVLPGYISLRVTTPASTGSITNICVALLGEHIGLRPAIGATQTIWTPGVNF